MLANVAWSWVVTWAGCVPTNLRVNESRRSASEIVTPRSTRSAAMVPGAGSKKRLLPSRAGVSRTRMETIRDADGSGSCAVETTPDKTPQKTFAGGARSRQAKKNRTDARHAPPHANH